jgi:hypothetical protein
VKRWKATLTVAVMLTGLTACTPGDKAAQPYQDSPRTGQVNNKPADIITMPDGFTNLASKCDGPNRVYVAYHGDSNYASVFVVPNDSRCKP